MNLKFRPCYCKLCTSFYCPALFSSLSFVFAQDASVFLFSEHLPKKTILVQEIIIISIIPIIIMGQKEISRLFCFQGKWRKANNPNLAPPPKKKPTILVQKIDVVKYHRPKSKFLAFCFCGKLRDPPPKKKQKISPKNQSCSGNWCY